MAIIIKGTQFELEQDEYGFWLYSYGAIAKHLVFVPSEIEDLRAILEELRFILMKNESG